MLTVELNAVFLGTPHAAVSVSPGYVKTALTGQNGFLTPEQGAKTPVEYALAGDNAASGTFVSSKGPIAW